MDGVRRTGRASWRRVAVVPLLALVAGCLEVETPEAPPSLSAQLEAAGVGHDDGDGTADPVPAASTEPEPARAEESTATTEPDGSAIEEAAREDPRLDTLAPRLRTELLPFYEQLLPMVAYGEFEEVERVAAREGARVFEIAADLSHLGFRQCFQPQSTR